MPLHDNFLPDFRGVTGFVDIQKRFISSACSIMREYVLECRGMKFSPTALELYMKLHERPDVWWDAATDKGDAADEQLNTGTWYVRRTKSQRRWRIDITAGDMSERIQAGLLIRQLNDSGGRQPGPATALHRLIRGKFDDSSFEKNEIDLINQIHGKRIDGSDGSPLTLKRIDAHAVILATGKRFNIPKTPSRNFEGHLICDARLRVSVWRKYAEEEERVDCEKEL